jgi:hypothetical protein
MTAELPRCAGCRVTIEPGQNVLFRTDGRVQHVACPEIACPVCWRPIVPTDPIRRDGDQLLHGNCWMRRTLTAGQRDFHPRRALIRAKLAAGLLPMSRPNKTWGGLWQWQVLRRLRRSNRHGSGRVPGWRSRLRDDAARSSGVPGALVRAVPERVPQDQRWKRMTNCLPQPPRRARSPLGRERSAAACAHHVGALRAPHRTAGERSSKQRRDTWTDRVVSV